MIFNDQVNLNSVVDNGDVVDNQELNRPLRYFSTSVRTDYLRFGNPNLQRFVFGGEGKGLPNTKLSRSDDRHQPGQFISVSLFRYDLSVR